MPTSRAEQPLALRARAALMLRERFGLVSKTERTRERILKRLRGIRERLLGSGEALGPESDRSIAERYALGELSDAGLRKWLESRGILNRQRS